MLRKRQVVQLHPYCTIVRLACRSEIKFIDVRDLFYGPPRCIEAEI
jgi:hypothetical protein